MPDTVLFETDDDINEQYLGLTYGKGLEINHVVRGLGLDADFANVTVDVGSGDDIDNVAIIRNDTTKEARMLLVDPRQDVQLQDAATNHVHLSYDPAGSDSISITVDQDGSGPAEPSLELGTVDTSANTTTETNRQIPKFSNPTFVTQADESSELDSSIQHANLPDGDKHTPKDDSVDASKLVDAAVDTTQLATDAVTEAKVASDAIGVGELQAALGTSSTETIAGTTHLDAVASAPITATLELSSDQSLSANTITVVAWDQKRTETNASVDLSSWVDTGSNGFTVPADRNFDEARFTVSLAYDTETTALRATLLRDGNDFVPNGFQFRGSLSLENTPPLSSGWIELSDDETYTVRTEITDSANIRAIGSTYYQLEVR